MAQNCVGVTNKREASVEMDRAAMAQPAYREAKIASRISGSLAVFLKRLMALFLFALLGTASAAQAQSVDWLLSVEDTGFDPQPAGGVIDYFVAIDNNGFDAAPATTMDFNVPAGANLVGTSGDLSNCAPASGAGPLTMTCDVPAIGSLGQVTQIVQVTADSAGAITVDAEIPTAGDILPANNDDDELTTILAGADIGLAVVLPPAGTAAAGSVIDIEWVATNNGPNASDGFVIEFPAPTGIVGISAPSGCSLSGGTYTCTIPGTIPVGGTVSRTFSGQVSAASSSDITVSASVNGQSPTDPVSSNNTATGSISITAGTDVAIDKSRSPSGSLLVGDSVTFTLDTSYTGDAPSGLTVTDTIPGNYAITNIIEPGGWSCSQSGQDVTCTNPGGGSAGADVSLGAIQIVTDVVSPGSATNTASISVSGPPDQDLGNNTDTDGGATIVQPTVDMRANKSGPNPALVVVGNDYNFQISTTNIGSADFIGTIQMVDTLPAGLTLNSVSTNGWSCSPTSGAGPIAITCTRDYTAANPLSPNETTSRVTLNTTATASGTLTNSLTVSTPVTNIADTNSGNNTITYGVTSVATTGSADITSSKSVTPDPIVAGEIATFELEIINLGPQPSLNVDIEDRFRSLISNQVGPTDEGFIGFTINDNGSGATNFTCSTGAVGTDGRQLSCSIDSLPVCTPGSTCPTIDVQVRPGDDGGSYTNTLDVISLGTPDPDLTNNDSSVTYSTNARADMTVTKTANPDPVAAGQELTYIVTAQNEDNGLSMAENVQIVDTLPADVVFVSASGPGATCSGIAAGSLTVAGSNDTLTCDMGDIANGAQRSVTIIVRPTNTLRGTSIDNDVTVSTTTVETDATNNDASVSVAVSNPDTDILVNKIDSVDPVTVGDTTVYTITVTNAGPSSSEAVVMTDTLPTSLVSYQSHTVSGAGACTTIPTVGQIGGTLVCDWPLILEGDSETVTVTVLAEVAGTVDNNVAISSFEIANGFDRIAANNVTSQDTTIRNRSDIGITKTGPAGPVALLENFNWNIAVDVAGGGGLGSADNVEVTDTLPADMELIGTPTASPSGTCTGVAGDTSFTCDLASIAAGSSVNITVPVQITAISSPAQSFTNTASVTTTSLDITPGNNTDTATVNAVGSSLAGTVFRDFNDDAIQNGTDSGIAGIDITISGTDVDGMTITPITVQTDGSGNYIFPILPAGNFVVTRGVVNEPFLTEGQNTAGSEGGGTPSGDVINAITLPADTDATDYDFAEIPQARVGLAKVLSAGPTPNADGTFSASFDLVVENFSLEPLINIAVTDPLTGANPLFGAFAALSNPGSDPMAPGSYTITGPPSGSCGGLNAGFNGDGDEVLANGFTLPVAGTCTLAFTIRVSPEIPVPTDYENQAIVTAEGQESGQTPDANPQLVDLSDDGTEPDANGDNQANEAGENDPTPLSMLGFAPDIELIKTVSTAGLSTPPQIGDELTYSFEIRNTGNVTLTNVTVTDTSLPRLVLSGSPIPSMAPGAIDTLTYTATYELDVDDLNLGMVTNQALVTGSDPFGDPVTDDSGTAVGNDDPTVVPLNQEPMVALVKTADDSGLGTPPLDGDVMVYNFAVTNTGNVTLTNVTVTDTSLPGLVLSGSPIPSLAPGETDTGTYSAAYAIDQDDINLGSITNQALVTGTPPTGLDVTDDSGTDVTNDDPTVTPINQAPSILLEKMVDDSVLSAGAVPGDVLPYTFTVTNTGNVTLTNVTIADALPGVVMLGGPITLAPGEVDTDTFTATYAIDADDITAGEVINDATVTGTFGPNPGDTVTDDDTVTAIVGNIQAIPEVFPEFTTDGGTTTSMLASDLLNNQPATLANVVITVLNEDPGVTLDPNTALITLEPGFPAGEYQVEYQICSIAVPGLCDTTIETVTQAAIPMIEVTKTQAVTDNGDGFDGVGDMVTYTITVANTGNVPLDNVRLEDTLTDLNGGALTLASGPDFDSADMASPEGRLEIGEIATYTATYDIELQAVNAGGLSNQAEGFGTPEIPVGIPGDPTEISDLSDDGDDFDGDTESDPTQLFLAPGVSTNGVTITKTTPSNIVRRGDIVSYTITITNENTFVVGPVDIVDTLPASFLYVPGSAAINGAFVPVDQVGRRVTWPGVTVPAAGTTTATLDVRILNGARSGAHVNTVSLLDSTDGSLVAGPATATVRILPEAVFDCGDIIGKVFEDHNGNGYQDPPGARDGAITDQTYQGDKYGKYEKYDAPPPAPRNEDGIPGVRIVAPDGTIITTDANGLYSVPCAALPVDRGSNYILKVDERTLPVGFRPTTENPRVVRLTPGMMSEVNFGAAPGRVVNIALNQAAFVGGKPSPALVSGIQQLSAQLGGEPVVIRLAWHVGYGAGSGEVAQGRALMAQVEKAIRREWRWKAGAPVRIVTNIVRGGE